MSTGRDGGERSKVWLSLGMSADPRVEWSGARGPAMIWCHPVSFADQTALPGQRDARRVSRETTAVRGVDSGG